MTSYNFYIPKKFSKTIARKKTSHLGVGAHPDDLEFMAIHGIADCYQKDQEWFSGIICTDGRGSIRPKNLESLSDQEWIDIRRKEQMSAADKGEYAFLHMLNYKSSDLLHPSPYSKLVTTLKEALSETQPRYLYTHSPIDRHTTHRLIAFATIEALRTLPERDWLMSFWGCEVWGSLDWLDKRDLHILDHSKHTELANELNQCFPSQILGGKNYAEAIKGRRIANACLMQAHKKDSFKEVTYALNLKPLIQDPERSIPDFFEKKLDRFKRSTLKALLNEPKEMT